MTQEKNQTINDEEFEALLNESFDTKLNLKEGEIVKGKVISLIKDRVIIDVGYKSEGDIAISEFAGKKGESTVEVGDEVDVFIESLENSKGLLEISKEKADRVRVWDEISNACENDEIIEGIITHRVKGGLSVSIRSGIKAFLPGSQVDLRPIRNLERLIGENCRFKVIKFNKKRGNIVLSRRALLEAERNAIKSKTLKNLEEGITIKGIVKNITEYGAFVDLGGIDGLLHITDMSWGRVNHPSEVIKVGEEIKVKILKYNAESERVSLGLKQTVEDPWINAESNYPIGLKVSGNIVSIADYGAFVELAHGVEGLIHVSEMSWTKRIKHPSKLFNVGDAVECVVLDVDIPGKRISLGLKQLEPHPWQNFIEKYNPGDTIKGAIRSITDYGVFIGIDNGIDGMVHKTDLSWTQRINHPSELFHKGDEVEAIILNIDHEEQKVSLGIKQLYEDPWEKIPVSYPLGRILEVKVIKITDFGAFVELEQSIEGLIHVSEMSNEHVDDPRKVISEGDTVKVEVITLDPVERKIGLSIKSILGGEADRDYAEHKVTEVISEKATLGDLLAEKLGEMAAGVDKDADKDKAKKAKVAKAEDKKTDKAEDKKADKAEDKKADKAEDKKADKVEDKKADKVETDKADKAETDKAEDKKADKVEVAKVEDKKADKAETDKSEDKKADKVEAAKVEDKKADKVETDKADKVEAAKVEADS